MTGRILLSWTRNTAIDLRWDFSLLKTVCMTTVAYNDMNVMCCLGEDREENGDKRNPAYIDAGSLCRSACISKSLETLKCE